VLIGSGSCSLRDIAASENHWMKLNPVTSSSFLAFDSFELLVNFGIVRSTAISLRMAYRSNSFGSKGAEKEGDAGDALSNGSEAPPVIEFTNVAPAMMPEIIKTVRRQDGSIVNTTNSALSPVPITRVDSPQSEESSSAGASASPASNQHPHNQGGSFSNEDPHSWFPDYRACISRSYDWLWHVGFNGLDPLAEDASRSGSSHQASKAQTAAATAATKDSSAAVPDVGADSSARSRSGEKQGNNSKRAMSPNSLMSLPVTASASVSTSGVSVAIPDNTVAVGMAGVDYDTEDTENIKEEVLFGDRMQSLDLLDPTTISSLQAAEADVGISSGGATTNPPLSPAVHTMLTMPRVDYPYPIPFLKQHIELMQNFFAEIGTLRAEGEAWLRQGNQFRPSTMKKEMKVQFFPTNLHIQLMCVQRHVTGRGNRQETGSVEVVDSITSGCMSPHGLGHKKGGLTVLEDELLKQKVKIDSLKDRFAYAISRRSSRCLSPHGPEADILEELGKHLLSYEGNCMVIGRRRVFALAQAVSTAATAFMLKLSLVLEGHIDASVAEKWLSVGFLIVFEGLLSVSGKEKHMLEDTQSAVEALKLFQIRLLPSPTITMSNSSSMYASSQATHNISAQTIYSDVLDVGLSGREIRIYLPQLLIARLPAVYKQKMGEKGAVLSLVPVLFTQVGFSYLLLIVKIIDCLMFCYTGY
jgi:hypothetical protein